MGEAKRRKAILGERYGKSLVFEKPEDYVAFGEKYIPLDIIDSAAHFSWRAQNDDEPEWLREGPRWNVRGLDELIWNDVTLTWLRESCESSFFQNLLPGYDRGHIFTVLAKAIAILAMHRHNVLYDFDSAHYEDEVDEDYNTI